MNREDKYEACSVLSVTLKMWHLWFGWFESVTPCGLVELKVWHLCSVELKVSHLCFGWFESVTFVSCYLLFVLWSVWKCDIYVLVDLKVWHLCSTDNSSTDRVETSLEWQEYFSQFQDTTNAHPCHIHLPASYESWTLIAELQSRTQAMEVRCYRKVLRISYEDHVSNEEVHAKVQQAVRPHKDLLAIVKRCKLQWYWHVFHSWSLAKSILQGTEKGEENRG